MASLSERAAQRIKAVESLHSQLDNVFVELNESYGDPPADNAKFAIFDRISHRMTLPPKPLDRISHRMTLPLEPLESYSHRMTLPPNPLESSDDYIYIFLVDDDILYPPDYVEKSVAAIEKYGCIISWHGRKLLGTGMRYYPDHKAFSFLRSVDQDTEIDVCGTGVTAFRSDYFLPKGLINSPDILMSDLVFSLEAARQGKKIMVISHKSGWFTDLKPNRQTTITRNESKKGDRQMQLADEIYLIKNKNG